MPDCRLISYGSLEYQQSCQLRHEVLRLPLGLSLSENDTDDEDKQYHFGIFDRQNLLGCVIVKPLSINTIKIRQMAIIPSMQNLGLGRTLLQFAENYCWKNGYTTLTLHARFYAMDFYLKQGYQICSEEFMEIGLPHVKMHKTVGH